MDINQFHAVFIRPHFMFVHAINKEDVIFVKFIHFIVVFQITMPLQTIGEHVRIVLAPFEVMILPVFFITRENYPIEKSRPVTIKGNPIEGIIGRKISIQYCFHKQEIIILYFDNTFS